VTAVRNSFRATALRGCKSAILLASGETLGSQENASASKDPHFWPACPICNCLSCSCRCVGLDHQGRIRARQHGAPLDGSLAATQPLSRSIRPTSRPHDSPIIEVDQPDVTKPIKPPVTIRVHFRPKEGATIDLTSFRVTYGWLALDITKRIMEHAHVSASGLLANNADVPAGRHRVTLQVADNMHRVGIRTFEFTVL